MGKKLSTSKDWDDPSSDDDIVFAARGAFGNMGDGDHGSGGGSGGHGGSGGSTPDAVSSGGTPDGVDSSGEPGGGGSGGEPGGGGGGGGGEPGGGGGGGGNGGNPGGEVAGNNLSFPAIFFDQAPVLRGDGENVLFSVATDLDEADSSIYFAQKEEGNWWQADHVVTTGPVVVDWVDIGDALESAPINSGTNIRLELSLWQDLANLDSEETALDFPEDGLLTGLNMTLLGGAKGDGKPDVTGPTEMQGAQLAKSAWNGDSYAGTIGELPEGSTFESASATIYAPYMSMSIQSVTGVDSVDDLDAFTWNSGGWVGAGVGANIVATAFGPELNIGGKYIVGASGTPFKFGEDGDYLITFAINNGAPVSLNDETYVTNVAGARETWVIEDGESHNGLLVMLVGVPSSPDEGGGEEG